jgi:hypothetical protein
VHGRGFRRRFLGLLWGIIGVKNASVGAGHEEVVFRMLLQESIAS